MEHQKRNNPGCISQLGHDPADLMLFLMRFFFRFLFLYCYRRIIVDSNLRWHFFPIHIFELGTLF